MMNRRRGSLWRPRAILNFPLPVWSISITTDPFNLDSPKTSVYSRLSHLDFVLLVTQTEMRASYWYLQFGGHHIGFNTPGFGRISFILVPFDYLTPKTWGHAAAGISFLCPLEAEIYMARIHMTYSICINIILYYHIRSRNIIIRSSFNSACGPSFASDRTVALYICFIPLCRSVKFRRNGPIT